MKQQFKEFLELTKEVRDAQKEYFKTRDAETLIYCKKIEGKLDASIKFYLEGGIKEIEK